MEEAQAKEELLAKGNQKRNQLSEAMKEQMMASQKELHRLMEIQAKEEDIQAKEVLLARNLWKMYEPSKHQ